MSEPSATEVVCHAAKFIPAISGWCVLLSTSTLTTSVCILKFLNKNTCHLVLLKLSIDKIVSRHCKQANWKLGLRNALHFSVSRGVIQRKERGPAKWQLAAYNCVHNKRMADGDRPTSTVNPQWYLQTRPSGTGSLEQYKIRPTC